MKRIVICLMFIFVAASLPQFAYAQAKGGEVKRPVRTTTTTTSPAKPKPKPTTGTLSISSTPSDAYVKIDGKYIANTPMPPVKLEPGTYNVTFNAEGYETAEKSVTVTAGQTATCTATLKKKQPQTNTATTTPATSSLQMFTANGVSFKMILVEGGTFTMGATSEQDSDAGEFEKPAHQVTLFSYYIGKTEVTQELWEAVMGSNPSYSRAVHRPVERVSWNDCQEFIKKLNTLTGKTFRLPTEAEWEYAARGGNKSQGYKYSGSNVLGNVAWYDDNSEEVTHGVEWKSPNELGIYDMSGNVYEWCQDWYDDYSSGSQTNPTGPSSGSDRVIRGGCMFNNAPYCRVTYRDHVTPTSKGNGLGMRLAL